MALQVSRKIVSRSEAHVTYCALERALISVHLDECIKIHTQ